MGGYCAWQLLMPLPNLFKKSIICCGGGMYWNAGRITTPIRVFHGKLDNCVNFTESVYMTECINENRKISELTIYDNLGHNVWDKVFNDKNNYEWLKK